MNTKRKFLIGFACILALIVYNRFMVSCKKPSSVTIDSVIKRLPSDARYLCIVNFGKHSGEERFFIYNVKRKNSNIADWCSMEMVKETLQASLSSVT